MAYNNVHRPEISHAKEVEERSFALASSREHYKEVDQADCFLLAFFVLKDHKSRQEADKRGTIVGNLLTTKCFSAVEDMCLYKHA